MTKKLLLIGWDAADWKTIERLVDQGDMPLMKGLLERLAEPLAEYRMRPEERGADVLEPLILKLQEIDLDKDKRPIGVTKILAETATIQARADWVMDHERPGNNGTLWRCTSMPSTTSAMAS